MVNRELRSPLTSIKGSIDTLLEPEHDLDPAETQQFFRIIRDQSNHMRELVGDLLDLARLNAGELGLAPEPVELAALVGGGERGGSSAAPGGTTSASTCRRTCRPCWRTGGGWRRR